MKPVRGLQVKRGMGAVTGDGSGREGKGGGRANNTEGSLIGAGRQMLKRGGREESQCGLQVSNLWHGAEERGIGPSDGPETK